MVTRSRQAGFTLLEVLIAMSILAVGATSVLSIFVSAIHFHTKRVEDNRITELYNFARNHAQIKFNVYDPSTAKEGEKPLPDKIVADLTDPDKAAQNTDPMIREAAEKFKGFRYEITFEDNDLAVPGSSVVAHIEIFGLSGSKDRSFFFKEFLTRTGAPIGERFRSPSIADSDLEREGNRRKPSTRGK